MATLRCETCFYYMPDVDEKEKKQDGGFCYRSPPQVGVSIQGEARSYRPPVKSTWWCGEWRSTKDTGK